MTKGGPMYGICSRATKYVAIQVVGLDTIVVNIAPPLHSIRCSINRGPAPECISSCSISPQIW
jgi:hypothetical protein